MTLPPESVREIPTEIPLLKRYNIRHVVVPFDELPEPLKERINVVILSRTIRPRLWKLSTGAGAAVGAAAALKMAVMRPSPSLKMIIAASISLPVLMFAWGHATASYFVGAGTRKALRHEAITDVKARMTPCPNLCMPQFTRMATSFSLRSRQKALGNTSSN
jgi:hypothetical protein